MPRPRSTPIAAYCEVAEVVAKLDALPSARDLADKYHVSESQIRYIMRQARLGLIQEFLSKHSKVMARDTGFVQRSEGRPRIPDAHLLSVNPDLEKMAEAAILAHEMREDRCETLPLRVRPYTPRPRPQTAIIGNRANEMIAAREWAEQTDEDCVEHDQINSKIP